jgi:chromosome segregation ATPase
MSQANPKYSDNDFAPKRERRGSATITNLPVNALTDEVDPTQEIRNLINELQNAARDSKTRAQQMEQERDDLAAQLEESMSQLADLRGKEREFRQQFMEVSALLRERDVAQDASERNQRKAVELESKLEAAIRERNDAQRQRDEAIRQREDATRRREEHTQQAQATAAQLAQAQKQVLSIRQARDAAQAQGLEHINNLQRLRDELSEAGYTRDAAQQAAKKAGDEAAELRFQIDAAAQERAAAAKQIAELSAELDTQRAKLLDLAEQKSQVAQADSEHSAALAEAREQMLHLTQERDAARARAVDQARELDELRTDLQKEREAQSAAQVSEAERADFQRQLAELGTDRDAHITREKEFLAETITQQERLAQITDQLMAAQKGREEALTSLTSAQKQIDHIMHDRDAVRQQGIENTLSLETQIGALRDQMAVCVEKTEEADLRATEMQAELAVALDKAAQAEKQRLFAIDLATQLDNAKRDLIRLTADLAEARLQAKFALTRVPGENLESRTLEIALDAPASAVARPPLPEENTEPLTEKDARGALSAMKHCHQSFTKQPGDFSLLNELHCHIHSFAERARVSAMWRCIGWAQRSPCSWTNSTAIRSR